MTNVSVFKNLEALTDGEVDLLAEIKSGVASLATARGVAADLRVTVLNPTSANVTIASGTVTTVTTVSTVTNQAQVGGVPANTMIPSVQNTAATAFAANVDRGRGALYG